MSSRDKLVKKLQAIQAKSLSERELGNEEAALACERKVAALLTRYRIERSEIERREDERAFESRRFPAEVSGFTGPSCSELWTVDLCAMICESYGVKAVRNYDDELGMIGSIPAMAAAEVVVLSLLVAARRDCEIAFDHRMEFVKGWQGAGLFGEASSPDPVDFRRSFFIGFVEGVRRQIAARDSERNLFKASPEDYALMARNTELKKVEQHLKERGIGQYKVDRDDPTVDLDRTAAVAGLNAGKAADMRDEKPTLGAGA